MPTPHKRTWLKEYEQLILVGSLQGMHGVQLLTRRTCTRVTVCCSIDQLLDTVDIVIDNVKPAMHAYAFVNDTNAKVVKGRQRL